MAGDGHGVGAGLSGERREFEFGLWALRCFLGMEEGIGGNVIEVAEIADVEFKDVGE